jgi:hypothetical protein
MTPDGDCRGVRELVPELALGIATGEERAGALEHLARCSDCRRLLDELSNVADELLLVAPSHEPPVGFETKVMDELRSARPARRARKLAALVAAAAVVATVSAALVYRATGPERQVAERYRDTLAEADGKDFSAATLYGASHREIGHAFGYEGSPSWIFVVVRGAPVVGRMEVAVVTHDGDRVALGSMSVTGGRASWGGVLRLRLHDVARVLLEGDGRAFEADL